MTLYSFSSNLQITFVSLTNNLLDHQLEDLNKNYGMFEKL